MCEAFTQNKLYSDVCEKNQSFDSMIQDFKNSIVDAGKRETILLAKLNKFRVEHEVSKCYMVKRTQ